MSETCCKKISNRDAWHPVYHTCGKPAKVEVDGKHYCGIHDPIKRERREQERQQGRDAEWQESRRIQRLHNASQDMLDTLQFLIHNCTAEFYSPWAEALDMARKAVTKATGK
jgi:hypothetical protein